MTTRSATRPQTSTQVPRPFSRRWELVLISVGAAITTVLLGGLALVVNTTYPSDLEHHLLPALLGAGLVDPSTTVHTLQTAASWAGFAAIWTLLMTALTFFMARRRPGRRLAGIPAVLAGMTALLGSALALFPIAFLFFLSAGLFVLRQPQNNNAPTAVRRESRTEKDR